MYMTWNLIEFLRVWNQRSDCEGREEKYQTGVNATESACIRADGKSQHSNILEQIQIWFALGRSSPMNNLKSLSLGSSVLRARA